MRTDLQNLHTTRQRTQPQPQDHRRGGDGSKEILTNTQFSCRRQGSPTAIDYRSGERARITMRPQIKCARSQGTTSPQICVTFRQFNSQPIIWHRGPRPRAHWYMCTDVANYQNHHSTLGQLATRYTSNEGKWLSNSKDKTPTRSEKIRR